MGLNQSFSPIRHGEPSATQIYTNEELKDFSPQRARRAQRKTRRTYFRLRAKKRKNFDRKEHKEKNEKNL